MHTGIAPSELMDSELMIRSAAEAYERFWPMERELLATIAEQLWVLIYVTSKAYGGKNLPDPLQVPRPTQRAADTRMADPSEGMMRFGEFAAATLKPEG